eukprot:m.292406 g.292406  ORF g.292406 m.292406 type:complete len:202 (-) comp20000_c0_seq4:55-660(-)
MTGILPVLNVMPVFTDKITQELALCRSYVNDHGKIWEREVLDNIVTHFKVKLLHTQWIPHSFLRAADTRFCLRAGGREDFDRTGLRWFAATGWLADTPCNAQRFVGVFCANLLSRALVVGDDGHKSLATSFTADKKRALRWSYHSKYIYMTIAKILGFTLNTSASPVQFLGCGGNAIRELTRNPNRNSHCRHAKGTLATSC